MPADYSPAYSKFPLPYYSDAQACIERKASSTTQRPANYKLDNVTVHFKARRPEMSYLVLPQ